MWVNDKVLFCFVFKDEDICSCLCADENDVEDRNGTESRGDRKSLCK